MEEYFSLLQQRSKWRASGLAMAINDVVLAKDENLPPMKWPHLELPRSAGDFADFPLKDEVLAREHFLLSLLTRIFYYSRIIN